MSTISASLTERQFYQHVRPNITVAKCGWLKLSWLSSFISWITITPPGMRLSYRANQRSSEFSSFSSLLTISSN